MCLHAWEWLELGYRTNWYRKGRDKIGGFDMSILCMDMFMLFRVVAVLTK